MNINEHRASTCPCVMTQRDNCGSRLLQPLVSVTKIGTQVSCHSKCLFFRSLSIKPSGPHAKMPQDEERRPSRGCGECFREGGSRSGRSPGRIKINVSSGEEGVKICLRFLGGRGGLWRREGRALETRPGSRSSAEGGSERAAVPATVIDSCGEDLWIFRRAQCAPAVPNVIKTQD